MKESDGFIGTKFPEFATDTLLLISMVYNRTLIGIADDTNLLHLSDLG
jgi:hypothetical protein